MALTVPPAATFDPNEFETHTKVPFLYTFTLLEEVVPVCFRKFIDTAMRVMYLVATKPRVPSVVWGTPFTPLMVTIDPDWAFPSFLPKVRNTGA